jgi:predicted secreted Zn-dependent protease
MRLDYSNYYPYARFYQRDHGLLTLRWRTQEVSLTNRCRARSGTIVIIWPGDFITPSYKRELADSDIYNIWQRMYMVVENHEEFHEHAARRETLVAAGQWV